jgi:hypothetical protein
MLRNLFVKYNFHLYLCLLVKVRHLVLLSVQLPTLLNLNRDVLLRHLLQILLLELLIGIDVVLIRCVQVVKVLYLNAIGRRLWTHLSVQSTPNSILIELELSTGVVLLHIWLIHIHHLICICPWLRQLLLLDNFSQF